MIGLEISLNGKVLFTISAEDPGFVSASVTRARRRTERKATVRLTATGANMNDDSPTEHLRWPEQNLKQGDMISTRVVEIDTTDSDPPSERIQDDSVEAEAKKRQFYERMRKEMGN